METMTIQSILAIQHLNHHQQHDNVDKIQMIKISWFVKTLWKKHRQWMAKETKRLKNMRNVFKFNQLECNNNIRIFQKMIFWKMNLARCLRIWPKISLLTSQLCLLDHWELRVNWTHNRDNNLLSINREKMTYMIVE